MSVVAWNEQRQLADTSGAFVWFGLIPCDVILPQALLHFIVVVAATSRSAGARCKRARFGEISRCLFSGCGRAGWF